MGSSPLTRGKPGIVTVRRARLGLIPAHAGKTFWKASASSFRGAHPRSRGENAWGAKENVTGTGSSPLTRGKLSTTTRGQFTTGLIPAHAGKTLPAALRLQKTCGSSPLTRGKHDLRHHDQDRTRLIPAHAGKTNS